MLTTIIFTFDCIRYFKCFFTPCLGILLGKILTSTNSTLAAADLGITTWVQTVVSRCAEWRQELKSLKMFLQTLNHFARLVLRQRFPSFKPQEEIRVDYQSPSSTGTEDPGASQVASSDNLPPGRLITGLLLQDELEFLDGCGIDVLELYNEPYQTVLALEKKILTEPDPHRQWWTFESSLEP